jgi:drug/metabolite transporter (DMT)-like permease
MTEHAKGVAMAVAGIVVLSPDALCVRLLDVDQWSLLFWRGLGMFAGLAVLLGLVHGRGAPRVLASLGRPGVRLALTFSASNILFITALTHTSVANTLAIISTAPVWGALLSRFFLGERLPRRTWIAAVLAVFCVGLIVSANLDVFGRGRGTSLFGDLAALVESVFMAASFVLARRSSGVDMTPCVGLAGLLTALVAAPLAGPAALAAVLVPARLPVLLVLVLFILPVSFWLLISAPRRIPAPEVNLIMLLEMVLGPFLVWLVLGEEVAAPTLAGGTGLLVVLGAHFGLGLRSARGHAPVRWSD